METENFQQWFKPCQLSEEAVGIPQSGFYLKASHIVQGNLMASTRALLDTVQHATQALESCNCENIPTFKNCTPKPPISPIYRKVSTNGSSEQTR